MTVLHRDALEASPLADLHAIASEIGIDGYRRLRKADLVDRILEQQGDEVAVATASAPQEEERGVAEERSVAEEVVDEAAEEAEARPRRRRGARGGRGRGRDDANGDRSD